MSLQDSLFAEDVEDDVTTFARNKTRKRALVFPPVNNYRRYIIHQLIQERFSDSLHTFSIGQGSARRTVVCYKSDLKSDWVPNVSERKTSPAARQFDTTREMIVEGQQSSLTSPEHAQLQRQTKSAPTVEIYRPPAARKADNYSRICKTQAQSTADASSSIKTARQRRPDRAVYVPRHRRSLEVEENKSRNLEVSQTNHAALNEDPTINNNSKLQSACCVEQSVDSSSSIKSDDKSSENHSMKIKDNQFSPETPGNVISSDFRENFDHSRYQLREELKEDILVLPEQKEIVTTSIFNETNTNFELQKSSDEEVEDGDKQMATTQSTVKNSQPIMEHLSNDDTINHENTQLVEQNVSDVLTISDTVQKKSKHSEQVPTILTSPEKKVKKVERPKSKPAPPPSPPLKISRDECDWDSLFDDNGDCLDPTLIEELTSAVGEVMVEQPTNNYKTYSKQTEVSSDEFAHVVEIYNFPSEFKTSDLAAVFSSFRNGGFELKWVDDTHCLGVFSSPLVAAEVLASNHPFVKTRPLSEASALSKTKARRSAEFLQPYRNRPETCAALARRLVTGALGVKLATARQEREHEKNVLREAKEKRRLANKQREDVWEGIIPEK